MKIVRVVGARPQFMQVPLLKNALEKAGHQHILLHTGQHYDFAMNDVFLQELGLHADHNLGVGSGRHGEMTGQMMMGIEKYVLEVAPDLIIVDGDTNTTLATALVASKLHIPLVHVEAGIRDWERHRPEEINRIVTDHVSDLNCAPVPRALENLCKEGLQKRSILTGDVLLDCFIQNQSRKDYSLIQKLSLIKGKYHIATIHRQENTIPGENSRFYEIITALANLDMPVVFPVHPRTRQLLEAYQQSSGELKNIIPIEPVSYLQMLGLLEQSECVFTDSGGLCREAAWSGVRCVMPIEVPIWQDLLDQGWAQIGSTDAGSILNAYQRAVRAPKEEAIAFFGGGNAAVAIATAIANRFPMKTKESISA